MTDIVNPIQQEVMDLLPRRRRASNGWISFNAVCCTHVGETADTRGRGGVRANADGSISYHCFNCGFKTGFYPGRPLSFKFRRLLKWMGASENTMQRLIVEALRIRELSPIIEATIDSHQPLDIKFAARALPPDATTLEHWATVVRLQLDQEGRGYATWDELEKASPKEFINALDYLVGRGGIDTKKYTFYVTDNTAYNMDRRVIIPLYWKGEIVGYTARATVDSIKPKYHSSHEPNYVFNMDQQQSDSKFVIVCEGPFDAMCIDGVAVMTNEISETQAEIIESLDRQVVVVPDWDEPGERMIDAALEYGWSVSFPVWRNDFKDINSAVKELGQLFVMKTIVDSIETNPVKIRLRQKL